MRARRVVILFAVAFILALAVVIGVALVARSGVSPGPGGGY